MMHHVMHTTPVPPQKLNFDVPNALGEVVMKGLNKKPRERYNDGRAFAAAMRESLKENPDPKVLGVELAQGGTMVGAAPADAGATVMTPSEALPDSGAAQGAAPPEQAAQAEPTAAATQSGATVAIPSGADAQQRKPWVLWGGIGGGVVVVAVLIAALSGAPANSGNGGGVTAGSSALGFAETDRVTVDVLGTHDPMVAADFGNVGNASERDEMITTLLQEGKLFYPPDAYIQVTNLENMENKRYPVDKGGVRVELPTSGERFAVEVGAPGWPNEREEPQMQGGAWGKQTYVLYKAADS